MPSGSSPFAAVDSDVYPALIPLATQQAFAVNNTVTVNQTGTELAYTEFTAPVGSITGTNVGTATTIVSSASVVFDGLTIVIVEFFCPSTIVTSATFRLKFELFEDSTDIGEIGTTNDPGAGTGANGALLKRRRTPTAAGHTYTVKAFVPDGGTGTVTAGAGGAATVVPGFIRVVKV